jgi:hypothetical protein
MFKMRALWDIAPCNLVGVDRRFRDACWATGRSGFYPRRGQRIFTLTSVSRPALGPTQPPVQWVPGVLSPGVKRGRGVMLTTHPI